MKNPAEYWLNIGSVMLLFWKKTTHKYIVFLQFY